MQDKVENLIKEALKKLGLAEVEFSVERPADMEHGDWASNVAMIVAKDAGKNPRELAEEMKNVLTSVNTSSEIEKVEVAGPGFINFHLKRDFFRDQIAQILEKKENYGKSDALAGKKVMVECATPNVFKPLHIGHLMDSSIGEAIARMLEAYGAEVKRDFYSGDIGLHVPKALWGMKQLGDKMPADGDPLAIKTEFLGNAYVHGSQMYEENSDVKEEIDELNIRLYKQEEEELKNLYDTGKRWSLEHFKEIFDTLGIRIDYSYFESQTARLGEEIVKKNMPGVFERSEGAVVYKGEDEGLHTRVFVTSKGVPTYEGKELALPVLKYKDYKYDESVIVTAVEQKEYFKVVMAALEKINPELAGKTLHITHGMMQLASGKMSSRKGNVITGESFLRETIERVGEVVADRDELSADQKKSVAKQVAVAAIKYAILKQASGKNIIYDEEKALSFEGDSGPYLQYTHARIRSLLDRARSEGVVRESDTQKEVPENAYEVEKVLERFPEIVERAHREYEPHYITTYLTELAGAFNSFYGKEKIVDKDDEFSPYKLMVSEAVAQVLANGLWLLGIEAPERM